MSKVSTNFKNVTHFKGWWTAKRIVGLETYLVVDNTYKITHQTIGDASDKYYCIECAAHPKGGMWVLAERGDYSENFPHKISLKDYCDKLTPDVVKQERVIDIPPNAEVCHTLDLERVQYIRMPTVDGHYEVTMGWSESIKLSDAVYPRKELVKKWKAYHGQEA